MSLQLLKIKAYQPFANFRKPFSYGFVDSYPLPPPSTVKGWLHNVLGAKEGEYCKMAVAIAGKFDSVVYDMQRIIKFDCRNEKSRREKYKHKVFLEEYGGWVISDVIYVANLVDVELFIYVNSEPEVLAKIQKGIFSSYWGLGRKEDLMRIESIDFVEASEVSFRRYIRKELPQYGVYLKKATADKFKVDGISFRLNYKYEKTKDNLRIFTVKKDIVYIDSLNVLGGISPVAENILVDDENIIIDLIGDEEYEN